MVGSRSWKWIAAAAALTLLMLTMGTPKMRAQGEASVQGIVTDATGSAVSQTTITVKDEETGAVRNTITDASGHYAVPLLPVGNYDVTASKNGFQEQRREKVTLVLGQQIEINFALQISARSETVQVSSETPGVQATTTDDSGLVGEQQVKDLPLNGRSFDNLLTLNPGIVNVTAQRSGGVGTNAAAVGNMFSAFGQRPEANLYLLNGVEYGGASQINASPGGASGQLLGVDAVREFDVVTGTYGAEYGKRSGAQVSIITTSGTNQFHGSVYEFARNSVFDARNFFDQGSSPPPFQRNVFGVSLGGPIQKNKTFVFGNYEGFRQLFSLSNVTFVPDDASRASAVASVQPLLALWPVANGPEVLNSNGTNSGIAINYNNPQQTIREDFGTTRVDHVFSDKDSLDAVYTIDDSASDTPSSNPLSLVDLTVRNQVASLSETHIFTPNVLNKFTFGFTRGGFFFNGVTPVNVPGWVAGEPIGALTIGGSTALNSSSAIANAGTNGTSNLQSDRTLFTISDEVLISHGIHQINAGVWFEPLLTRDNLAADQYGQAVFTTLQSFLQGTIATFTAIPSPTVLDFRSLEGAYYIEDTMKLKPSLELSLGFRAEFTNGWNEANGRSSNWLYNSEGIIETNPLIGTSPFTVNKAKFLPAPRVNVAWSPFSKKTVIRAGFGIYYSLNDDLSYRLTQSAPFNTVVVLKNIPVSSSDFPLQPGAAPPSGSKISPAGVQPDLDTPTLLSYGLTLEQQLTPSTTLTVGYIGNHGYHELLSIDANTPIPTICPASPCPAGYPAGITYYAPNAPLANPNLANTTQWFSWGVSNYNALKVDLSHRFSHGLQFRGNYTLSKSLDEGSSLANAISGTTNAFTMDPHDARLDYGLSSFNAEHVGSINVTYALPFGRGALAARSFLNKVISDWQVSTIILVESGLPFSPQLGFNPTNDGDSRNPIRPSWNPTFTGNVIEGNPNQYFNPNAFTVPLNGTYGNVGRDSLIGPGLAETDLSVAKGIPLRERLNLQFRADIFNLFNRANFNAPNPIVFTSATFDPTTGVATASPSATAGAITSTATTSRQVQFALKLLW